jgi:anti-sigma B factor antagonist
VGAGNQLHRYVDSGVRIAVSESDTTTTVHLEGELDLVEREDVRDAILEALERRPGRLIVDLGRLSFIDSSGVHLLIEAVQQSAERGVHLTIVPGPPSVHRIFEICNLTDLLPFLARRDGGRGTAGLAPPVRHRGRR